jgi:hypothetical protein
VGVERAADFWRRFRARFVTEQDIARIAAAGFDHVRLPINSRVIQAADGTLDPEGIALVDDCLSWCKSHDLYLLLDLHGAPGGQTGTNIDDSPNGRPDLFTDERHREATIELWAKLAQRYAAEEHVLGYDLLNEPLPNEWQHRYPDELVSLYIDLTEEIRCHDSRHLIMYEGTHWATNWSIFTEVWDQNSVLQFHKYWSAPDRASLGEYLETRDRLGLPIYMGEGGENTLEWLYAASRLYESEGIGWNLWPWKKVETSTSPASIRPPEGWWGVVDAVDGRDEMKSDRAWGVLEEYLEAIAIENCEWRPDVVAAVLGRHVRAVPAWGYGQRGAGLSFSPATGVRSVVPQLREGDAVAIGFTGHAIEHPFEHSDGPRARVDERLAVTLEPGQWLEYEFEDEVDPSEWTAWGPHGQAASVDLSRGATGLRVTAPVDGVPVRIVRLTRGDARAHGRIPS